MDKEAATIIADSIKELKSAIMFWAIAYKEHTAFQKDRVEVELGKLTELMDETKNNDHDNDGN